MDHNTIIAIIVALVFLVVSIVEAFIIRGAMVSTSADKNIKNLTGIEIEVIRRKLSTVGMPGISSSDVFNLIKTLRDTNLGTYVDPEPYFPADPYEDINE